MTNKTPVGSWFVAIVIVAAAVAAGVYMFRHASHGDSPETVAPPVAVPATVAKASSAPNTVIAHPISDAQGGLANASTAALPALNDSDAATIDALSALTGGDALRSLLVPTQVITHFVATVDALPRQGIGNWIIPLRTPKGTFATGQANGAVIISDNNANRYAPYMAIVQGADPRAWVAWYKHNYPLFQEAYRELGYQHGYFNDRLIVAIDDMLSAPDPQAPIAVINKGTRYVFADPTLQSLSVGQKLMVRLGPQNEAKVKAQLRTMRSLIAAQPAQP